MEAIILAGGLGTRLRPVISDLPKPMAPIAGVPFLEILLRRLETAGFDRIILSVGYLAEKIIQYFGNKLGQMELIYEIEERKRGTGGAIGASMKHCREAMVFVLNGDSFIDVDYQLMAQDYQQNKNPLIVGCEVEDTGRYGRLILDEKKIVEIREKAAGGPGVINSGVYLLPSDMAIEAADDRPVSFETDLLPELLLHYNFSCFKTVGVFIDIGLPEQLAQAAGILRPFLGFEKRT